MKPLFRAVPEGGSRHFSTWVVPEVVPDRFRTVPAMVPPFNAQTGSRRRDPRGGTLRTGTAEPEAK